MNSNDLVKIISSEGLLHISLNRPDQLNALSHELLTVLNHVLMDAKDDPSIRGILLTGEGKTFCAGADIKQLSSLNGSTGLKFALFGQQVLSNLAQLGKPSLAAIHGFALGGGCELAMAATLRIAANNAVFGQPEIKLGVIPGFGGTQRLSRLIGFGRALEICLTGRRFSAEEALQWGFLNAITPAENLISHAKNMLKEMVTLSPAALKGMMTVISQGFNLPLEEALGMEAAHFGICCTTKDKTEGVTAFLQKRVPVFSGE